MFQPLRTGLVILSTATLLTACGEPEDTRPGEPVKQRQTAFKDIIKSFEPMGVMLRKGTYDAERVEKFTAELIARRDQPWGHFGPDTNYPPSKATPEVWSKPAEYKKPADEHQALIVKLAEAAKGGDLAQIRPAFGAAQKTCKACHEVFKND